MTAVSVQLKIRGHQHVAIICWWPLPAGPGRTGTLHRYTKPLIRVLYVNALSIGSFAWRHAVVQILHACIPWVVTKHHRETLIDLAVIYFNQPIHSSLTICIFTCLCQKLEKISNFRSQAAFIFISFHAELRGNYFPKISRRHHNYILFDRPYVIR